MMVVRFSLLLVLLFPLACSGEHEQTLDESPSALCGRGCGPVLSGDVPPLPFQSSRELMAALNADGRILLFSNAPWTESVWFLAQTRVADDASHWGTWTS